MIGQILDGRYQIIQELGRGGFGETFVAIDTKRPGNPHCVVKQLQPKSTHPRALELGERLFRQEAEKLENLGNHDQIPRLLAYFQERGEFYLVQEFIPGSDLTKELPPGVQLSETYVIRLLQEILEVLAFVHQSNLIHRDLKPSNIRRRQSDQKIVLIDFGAVKEVTSQEINAEGKTKFTIPIGSPGYMPNEQANGQPKFSSDIYAVGIIAIQALTGINPDPRALNGGITTDTSTGEIAWKHRVAVNSRLGAVIDKMVRANHLQRYQNAAEALQAITSLTNNSHSNNPTRFLGKWWLGIGLVGVVIPALVWWMTSQIKPPFKMLNYSNYGINIKYPEMWRKREDGFSDGVKFFPSAANQAQNCTTEISVNRSNLAQKILSLDEYKKSVIRQLKESNPQGKVTESSTYLTPESFDAYKLVYNRKEDNCNFQIMEIGTVRNAKAYVVIYSAPPSEYEKYLPIAEEMINSLTIVNTSD
ncbi:serine/threonine-protein kinase [Calothrix sp. 336/3]|uniref:serine/threonine-protein kinase n=1 Tax=Calothrix sp. 336/3 TaxID=1337936 RepID=UPI0004E45FCA|nr:serine/threonine-protein kinase [Calothrix sp. 336/3]AKG22116.1 hypothetical protein IJ00_13370 [Calothrix sp. 336/3]